VDEAFDPEQLPWFQSLVECPSHTYAKRDVEAAYAAIDEMGRSLDLRRQLVSDDEGRFADHRIFSSRQVRDNERALALVGHVDTVFPRSLGFLEFRRDPPDSESGGDVVRGPGVLDMKSGLSAILFALQAVKRAAPDTWRDLRFRFVCNSDEEVGSPSSAALFERLAPLTTMAMVFEGGRDADRVITRRKGGGRWELTVMGKAAHAGNDHVDGINAIHALALLIPKVEALTDYERGVTVNVGLIEGGTAKNTVPEQASCVVDTRFESKADADAVVTALRGIAVDPWRDVSVVPERLRGASVELRGRVTRLPLEASPTSQSLRSVYEGYAASVGLGIGEAPLQGGGSDANLLSSHGVPSIDGLGPHGKFFHRVEEWSSLSSLRRRTQALACFLVGGIERVGAA
jgi:glutamate carboxypeptidase